jgi:hypothetical protein
MALKNHSRQPEQSFDLFRLATEGLLAQGTPQEIARWEIRTVDDIVELALPYSLHLSSSTQELLMRTFCFYFFFLV